jgi:hypothetical protein
MIEQGCPQPACATLVAHAAMSESYSHAQDLPLEFPVPPEFHECAQTAIWIQRFPCQTTIAGFWGVAVTIHVTVWPDSEEDQIDRPGYFAPVGLQCPMSKAQIASDDEQQEPPRGWQCYEHTRKAETPQSQSKSQSKSKQITQRFGAPPRPSLPGLRWAVQRAVQRHCSELLPRDAVHRIVPVEPQWHMIIGCRMGQRPRYI